MARVLPILTNEEAIAVNRQWAGHPGQLKVNHSEVSTRLKLVAVPCDSSRAQQQAAWRVENTSSARLFTVISLTADRFYHAYLYAPRGIRIQSSCA